MNRLIFNRATLFAIGSSLLLFAACGNSTSSNTDTDNVPDPMQQQQSPHAPHQPTGNPTPPQQTAETEPVSAIPDFTFYQLKSGFSFEKSDIPDGRNTVFILFDPSCGHCQQEAAALAQNYDKLKNVNLLFVSMNDPALMDKFFPSFAKDLEGKDNVKMLYDRNQEFIRRFHIPSMFPANYVYGSDGTLKSHWSGEKGISQVLAAFVE